MRNNFDTSPKKYMDKFESDVAKNTKLQNFKIVEKKMTILAANEAAEIIYEVQNPESDWNKKLRKARRFIIVTPELIYYIQATSTADKWKLNDKDFNKILESLVLMPIPERPVRRRR